MNDDKNHVDISDGIEINSLSSYEPNSNNENEEDKKKSGKEDSFKDLEETNFEEKVNLNSISDIDSIEFTNKDDFFPEIFIKKFSPQNFDRVVVEKSDMTVELNTDEISGGIEDIAETGIPEAAENAIEDKKDDSSKNDKNEKENKHIEDKSDEINDVQAEDAESAEPLEEAEEVIEVLEAEEISDDQYDEITPLMNKIDRENDTVEYPGTISLIRIDKKLSNPELEIDDAVDKTQDTEEVFGIKKAEVFYTIDKKIYSSRRSQNRVISKIKDLKNGLFLPMMVVAISAVFLSIAVPLILVYLNLNSNASIEENFISDNSILEQIARQKEEEARLAKLALEEKLKNLEFEKTMIQSTINEELLKKQTEIENDYQKKLRELENRGGSQQQIDLLKKQLDDEKNSALASAKNESDKKIEEQQLILDQKNRELLDADSKLTEALKNKNYEISLLTKNLEDAIKEKDLETQNISQKLQQLSETNRRIKEFNQAIYQMIIGAIEDFKNDNKESSLTKLENVVKYYNSSIEFVNANEELSSKMATDFAFIQTITGLINDSKNSLLYDQELVKVMNRFRRITEYFKNAEISYAKNDFSRSSEEYAKVLGEFDEVNVSYNRLKLLEKQIQNVRAVGYYNQAIADMKNSKYELAIQELASVIRETPVSDYASQALNDIVTLSDTMSASAKTVKSNEQAKNAYERAGEFSRNKQYKEAISAYQNVIINYPFSDYINDSLKSIIDLQSVVSRSEFDRMDERLRENFRSDYSRYLELSKGGNMTEAREYYFSALKNAFNLYTDNSIPDFKAEEDKYIAALVDKNRTLSGESAARQIEDAKASLTKEYAGNLEKLKKEYEDQIALLKNGGSGKTSTEELEKLRTFYEGELKSKNNEIEKIKKDYDARIAALTKTESGGASNEEIDELKRQYAAEIDRKNKEIGRIKADLADAQKSSVSISESDLKREQENVAKLKQQLFDLYIRYNKVEQKLKEAADDSALAALQKKYDLLQMELDVSRSNLDRLKKQYDEQIALLKKNGTVKTSAEELDKLKADYDNDLKLKNAEIERLKTDYENRINQMKKDGAITVSQAELNNIKKQYQDELDKKNREIEGIKSELTNVQKTTKSASDLKKEQDNTANLQQQLYDLYKRYNEIELKLTQSSSSRLIDLQKKYDLVKSELDASRNSLDTKIKDLEKKSQEEIKRQVNIEKDRLQKQFDEQIRALSNQNSTTPVIKDKTSNGGGIADIENLQNKYIARIVEVIDDSVTFQFLSADFMKDIKTGDRMKISRLSKNASGEYKETVLGEIQVALINNNSLFGRGKISAALKNVIQINDLLKK